MSVTSDRQRLKDSMKKEVMKLMTPFFDASDMSARTRKIVAEFFVNFTESRASNRTNKALRDSFLETTAVISEISEIAERVDLGRMAERYNMPPPGYKLVPLDPITDSPAYGT